MAQMDRPAWFGRVADSAERYLRRPRHGRDANWVAVGLVAAVLFGIGAAAYTAFRSGDGDERPAVGVALPTPSEQPAVPVSIAPAPTSPKPSLSPPVVTSKPARVAAPTRTKAPVFEERVIASTSVLTTGQSWSTNRLRLTVTGGGNLVLQDQGRTVWQTGTTDGVKLVMQNDGHLVLYDAGNGTAFSSGTAGNPGAVLVLRADGNMVIERDGRVLFETRTGD